MSHLTVAVSEGGFKELFAGIVQEFTFADANSGSFGPFTAGYDVALHLEGGSVDLRADNSIHIEELDIKWDKLEFFVGIDIPEICVGGWCIVPNPFGGCLVRLPKICVFSADPDIMIPLDLDSLITSEVTLSATPAVHYFIDPGRTPAMNDWDAQDADVPNMWQVRILPFAVDVDIVDVADTIGDLLDDAIEAAVDALLGPLPGWAKDLIKAILGSVVDLVRVLLDIGDDIGEWLTDLLGVSLGLFNTIANVIGLWLAANNPIEFEDPLQVLEADPIKNLVAVKVPVRNLSAVVNDVEMVLTADVGA